VAPVSRGWDLEVSTLLPRANYGSRQGRSLLNAPRIPGRAHQGGVDLRGVAGGGQVPDQMAIVSPAGNFEYRFLDFCLGEIAHCLEVEMRDVGQFVGRDHAIDNGRAVGLERLADGLA
jgi:hypothetical protein